MPELYQELVKLSGSDMYPFHMPGHKRNLESTPMKGAFRCDITEIDDFDNLHDEEGIILEAEERANRLYGADKTYFLVNGSSCGVLAALSAAVPENGAVLAARGSHKSFYHAAYLRHLDIHYLPYKINEEYGIPESYRAEDVAAALEKEKVSAVFITSPTYEGKCSEVGAIAKLCHEKGIPLIVDEAHGAHFGFYQGDEDIKKNSQEEFASIPDSSVHQGADIVIHSVHKTLPSMTQTALIHVQGNLVDKALLKRFLRIYQSSSPSYVLMSSIDLAMKEIEQNGKDYFSKLLYFRNKIDKETSKTSYLKVVGRNDIEDAAKVLIFVKKHAMTGQALYDILRKEFRLQLEMAGEYYVLAIITGSDTEEGIDRLIAAVNEIDGRLSEAKEPQETDNLFVPTLPEKALSLCEAWDSSKERVRLRDCAGRISAEFINLYPPGIPIVAPGEVISQQIAEELNTFIKRHMNLQGVEALDDGENYVQVVAQNPLG
jgi:arginine/lysine/ornithine decarboxylase